MKPPTPPGGHFVLAGKAPKKQAFTDAVMWDAEECKRMGIEIKTGVTVTPELIKEVKPDYVIVRHRRTLRQAEHPRSGYRGGRVRC